MGKHKDLHAGVVLSDQQIQEEYFLFLCRMVSVGQDERYQYMHLLKKLHSIEFRYFVPNDDNRAADGDVLRDIFVNELDLDLREFNIINKYKCSVLEMMIALSIKIGELMGDFDGGERIGIWFWDMVDNLGLLKFTDDEYYFLGGHFAVMKTVNIMLDRNYGRDGVGGLFPLRKSQKDQRKVEIWYQMHSYLHEKYRVDCESF